MIAPMGDVIRVCVNPSTVGRAMTVRRALSVLRDDVSVNSSAQIVRTAHLSHPISIALMGSVPCQEAAVQMPIAALDNLVLQGRACPTFCPGFAKLMVIAPMVFGASSDSAFPLAVATMIMTVPLVSDVLMKSV